MEDRVLSITLIDEYIIKHIKTMVHQLQKNGYGEFLLSERIDKLPSQRPTYVHEYVYVPIKDSEGSAKSELELK